MKYPSISDEEFYTKIKHIYNKFTIPKRKKTLEQICFPKKYELQLPQQFLPKYINPNTPYKGVLVYHRIGAGKTCTGIRIAEEWKNYRNIVVVVPASLKGNFRNELRSMCAGNSYLKSNERVELAKLHPSSQEYKNIIATSDARIDKYYSIYSYNKFTNLAQSGDLSLRNSILIIDEIQNMVSEDGTYYNVLYDLIKNAPAELRTVLLSATPMFDKPIEIALTMNLLRIPNELPTGTAFTKKFIKIAKTRTGKYNYRAKNLDLFKEHIKGYVSYFRGAPPHVFPELTIRYVKCEMGEYQYNAYKAVLHNEEKEQNLTSLQKTKKRLAKALTVGNLPNNFFIGTRMVSNIVFPNKKINEEGFRSFKGKHVTQNLEKYSIKFSKIMNKIQKMAGKAFVYSGFKEFGGIHSFTRVLDEFGYKNYIEYGSGKKRYAVWSGDENIAQKEEIKAVYNRIDNLNGSKIKVLLGSPSIKEGVSLTAVRQVHVMEPYWNRARMEQVIGRASRFCSHKDVPEEKRNVKVYIYISTHKHIRETVDEYINYLSIQKNKLIGEFETAIKESAIDCAINKNANVFVGEADIKCDK